MSSENRIAITGLGLVGPWGTGLEGLWDAQTNGTAGFTPCSRYDNSLPAAEAQKLDLRRMLKSGQLSRAPLVSQYAVAATHLAVTQADMLPERGTKNGGVGIVFGTSNGPGAATQQIYDDLIDTGPTGVKPRVFQESVFNAPASLVSIHFGFAGPIQVVPAAGCSGTAVLFQAQMMLAQPEIEAVIALCSDEMCDAIQKGLRDLKWHADYDGLGGLTDGAVAGEGAVAMILERATHAEARGARVLAELAGVGLANDAAALGRPAKDGRGLVAAIETALEDAQTQAGQVDIILTGSAATKIEDQLESTAITTVFGEASPVQGSSKRSTGFAMGTAALVEIALAVAAINRNATPASVPGETANIDTILCNAIGLNGQFGATLIKGVAA
ncbi:beta-ketoacyl synthase N-terminal-like domain-containing protein [Phaeobacter sp.]|uniref:beta-ketoacyl synthase N-terminal-like domain-containing protein n=1 Tax=Phaeobacter sp. TaxID=1902409 RepID=UPI0025E7B61F|nr:beta-ketoacyl synthase N-terminal-like domain-containing protein [Phaeobacter sp.]